MAARAAVATVGIAAAFIAGLAGLQLGQEPGQADHVAWREIEEEPSERVPTAGEIDAIREAVTRLERGVPKGIASIPVPESATLLGKPYPLHRPDVREELAYELVLTVGKPLMPMLWQRRAPHTLPMIEERLAEAGLPDDLKYLAMIESDLRWQVLSPAGAEGLWQFIRGTGRRYGLSVTRYLDERRDPEKATDAAIRYLSDLFEQFGDWYLACAAYNTGENRVETALEEQGRRSYFDLYLPRETRRYLPRMLAAKLVYENPEAYGLATMKPIYVPTYRHVEVEVRGGRADLQELAREHGLDYAQLRVANPQIRGSWLPRGAHTLRVPEELPPAEQEPAAAVSVARESE